MNLPPSAHRRYDLDWLRIFAIATIFVFHTGRFFDPFDWHVKNPIRHYQLGTWTMFLASWGMPLIFTISGASLYFSLGKIGKFLKDKVMRLLIPLVVGVFTHVALGVYLERLTHHQFRGSFFDFYPQYFNGFYGDGGNFAWMGLHLWYLLVLFVYSIAFLPIFYTLKGKAKPILDLVGKIVSFPGVVYLLAAPIAWIMITVNPFSTFGERAWGGWSLLGYIPFLFYGFLLISSNYLQKTVQKWRWASLGLALICTFALASLNSRYGNPFYGSRPYAIINGLLSMNAWLWVLSLFGFGMKYLNTSSKILFYATEAVLPFYILHQTVLLCVGYYITRWNIPDITKFAVIFVTSFGIIMALYELVIRRINIVRVLFGLKVLPKTSQEALKTPGLAGQKA